MTAGTVISENITLTAAWTEKSTNVSFKIDDSIKDVEVSITKKEGSNFIYVLTASDGFESYEWCIISQALESKHELGKQQTIEFDTTNLKPAVYPITLFAVKKGVTYSTTIKVVVKNEQE